jgi:hypothetical protein
LVIQPFRLFLFRREGDLPANRCNGQFRADGKQKPALAHRLRRLMVEN